MTAIINTDTGRINELYLITVRNRLMATPEQKQTINQINAQRNVTRLLNVASIIN